MNLIYLMGNMCAGKSTLARGICEVLPHYEHFEIDAYRRRHQADIMEYEVQAWEQLSADLKKCEYAILDTTGIGVRAIGILEAARRAQGTDVLIIRLEVGESDARLRFTEREKGGYEQPPFPYNTTRWESFARIERKLDALPYQQSIPTGDKDANDVLTQALDLIQATDFL